jgi:hypothetical protein
MAAIRIAGARHRTGVVFGIFYSCFSVTFQMYPCSRELLLQRAGLPVKGKIYGRAGLVEERIID